MTISERLFYLLDSKQLKSSELANILGVGTGQISTWKKRNTDPPSKFIPQICEFLGVTYQYLLTGENSSDLLNDSDQEWLSLIHQLPIEAQLEFKGELKGYIKCLNSSVAAENLKQTGTDNLGK